MALCCVLPFFLCNGSRAPSNKSLVFCMHCGSDARDGKLEKGCIIGKLCSAQNAVQEEIGQRMAQKVTCMCSLVYTGHRGHSSDPSASVGLVAGRGGGGGAAVATLGEVRVADHQHHHNDWGHASLGWTRKASAQDANTQCKGGHHSV